jgi:hypothetical protein
VEPRQDPGAASDVRRATEIRVERDRALDRGKGVVEPADDVRGRRELLQHCRLLGCRQPVDERRGTPVVRIRLAVGLQRGRSPRGDERVVGDDALCARGFGVVDDVGRIRLSRQQSLEDLGV